MDSKVFKVIFFSVLMDKKFSLSFNTIRIKKDPWVFSTLILGIILIVLIVLLSLGKLNGINNGGLKGDDAGMKVVGFLNPKVGGGVTYTSFEDLGDLYQINVMYKNQAVPVFITKDGEYFIQAAVPMNESVAAGNNTNTSTTNEPKEISVDDDAFLGKENAPVTIVEFSDYQCPFCERFYLQTLDQLKKEYIDTGKVKLVYRDFPLEFHPYAQKAAEAAECAGEQGKYYQMHNKLFENQVAIDIPDLKKYAKDIGLNTAQFNTCLDTGKMKSEVENDYQEGISYGVTGTPAFFINGKLLEGAQPFSAFKQAIDAELNK